MRCACLAVICSIGCNEASSAQLAHSRLTPELDALPTLEVLSAKPSAPAPSAPWPSADIAPQLNPPALGDRVYSKVRHLWIRSRPGSAAWLGYLSLGDSVRVKGGVAADAFVMEGGRDCDAWYAVEPFGVVCVGENATLDARDPVVMALQPHAADRTSPWPFQYAESLGAQLLPLPEKLALPPGGITPQISVAPGSTFAFTDSIDHDGERFLRTWDGALIPASAGKPYPESHFAGVPLGQGVELPIAFFRHGDGHAYQRGQSEMTSIGQRYRRLAAVALSGETIVVGGAHYHRARHEDVWIADAEATVARRRDRDDMPLLAKRLEDGRRTWLDISIEGGTLVAYEGEKPVYATLISPGRGGMPLRGVPTLDSASTPIGVFKVLGKFLTATMQSGSIATLIHAEVQYTMNFDGPYALHGAYWHDRWGEKKSGGCVNLSPIDSQRIFEWSEPRLPVGWHGMRTMINSATVDAGPQTLIYLHR